SAPGKIAVTAAPMPANVERAVQRGRILAVLGDHAVGVDISGHAAPARTPCIHAGALQSLQRQRAIRTSVDGNARPASPRLDTDRASPAGVTLALTRSSATRPGKAARSRR